MKTIELENGSFTLQIENNFMSVYNNAKGGEYVCATNINQIFVKDKQDKKEVAVAMLTNIISGLVREGIMKAADEVRFILKGIELGF